MGSIIFGFGLAIKNDRPEYDTAYPANPGIPCILDFMPGFVAIRRLLAIIATCCTFLLSCQKQYFHDPRAFPESLKRYFSLRAGTAWYYREILSGSRDSVLVTSVKNQFENYRVADDYKCESNFNDNDCIHECMEIFEIQYLRRGDAWNYNGMLEFLGTSVYDTWRGNRIVNRVETVSGSEYNVIMFDTASTNFKSGLAWVGILDSISVPAGVFNNVVVIRDSIDFSYDSLLTVNYYSPGFGRIRTDVPDTGEVWELEDFIIK